ncbi:hypothetical protein AJ85_17895 [Alkalihalobacillus alcalophilus ATCC 27647 = CGMCC 1.3604]|uniref:Uncharacterized protein n=1 Tax=Alkalihalobacillus alcalophilus ATCC 27647 = CGMCC 1.3604 TaxID=1218173 RepID=A0A094WRG1_ALKAL|nr:hypothetical protein [Alkalihalobacillus alcalophilus]KGA98643.1 hypothetical protein BALCAV_0203195 [Alkalihalobacillus alcalophilus ATCC 27647 = CGMCC 1.3604]MED1564283.1 hypothetical protein [Alkalihalobacillus alcalophilus]THG89408.1 hypothetical protein AJ85_17895 [Alkalihalobacillus alcalophilus ATCC 27647 = CGMCC 1.3604]
MDVRPIPITLVDHEAIEAFDCNDANVNNFFHEEAQRMHHSNLVKKDNEFIIMAYKMSSDIA